MSKSPRIVYLIQRLLYGTLSLNPFSWIPILMTGPRPTTQRGLRDAIIKWTDRRFTTKGFKVTVRELVEPPPFLTGQACTRDSVKSGVALLVDGPGGAQLQAWVASDGSNGCYTMFAEGDGEILPHALPRLPDEGDALRELDNIVSEFVLHCVLVPSLESWLDSFATAYNFFTPKGVSGTLKDSKISDWIFVEFAYLCPIRGELSVILGIQKPLLSIGSRLCAFTSDEAGLLNGSYALGSFKSPEALHGILDTTFQYDAQSPIRFHAWDFIQDTTPLKAQN